MHGICAVHFGYGELPQGCAWCSLRRIASSRRFACYDRIDRHHSTLETCQIPAADDGIAQNVGSAIPGSRLCCLGELLPFSSVTHALRARRCDPRRVCCVVWRWFPPFVLFLALGQSFVIPFVRLFVASVNRSAEPTTPVVSCCALVMLPVMKLALLTRALCDPLALRAPIVARTTNKTCAAA